MSDTHILPYNSATETLCGSPIYVRVSGMDFRNLVELTVLSEATCTECVKLRDVDEITRADDAVSIANDERWERENGAGS